MATKVAIEVDIKTGGATDNIASLGGELEKVKETQGKLTDQMKTGFEAAGQGAKGASKGMKSFGGSIGGVLKSLGLIAIAMQVFMFLKDLLMKNQKVMDALSTATVAFEIIMNKVVDAVMRLAKPMQAAFSDPKQAVLDLWETIKTNFVSRLEGVILAVEAAGKAIEASFNFDWDAASDAALDFGSALIQVGTGLDAEQQKAFLEGVKDFANEVGKATLAAVAQADALVRLRNEVKFLDVEQRRLQLTYQKDAEIQRQIRDDISRTLADRIAANDELKKVLDKQIAAEQIAVDKKIELAEAELALNTKSVDLQVALKEAKLAQAELDERITSQNSEQLTNQKSLEKELFDLKLELAKVGREQRELELLELEQHFALIEEQARLAGDTTTNIEGAKQDALAKLRKKFRDEDLANEKKLKDDKIKLQQDYLSATGGVLGAIDQLVAASGKNSKQALVLQKTLAVAQIAIDTAKAIVGAIAQAQSVPYPGNLVAIATGVAAVIAGIASAVTTLNSADVGGATAAQPQAPQITSAPAVQQVTSGTTELGGVGQAQLAPIQAYVVETELTGNQNNVNQIESQANFE
jgi:uncharacterized protein YraI